MTRQRRIHHPPSSILHSSPHRLQASTSVFVSISVYVCVISHTCLPFHSHETGSNRAPLLFRHGPQYQAWRLTPGRGSINTICIHVHTLSRGRSPHSRLTKRYSQALIKDGSEHIGVL
uniref:Uncharacterized protein n=1 Tax=Mus musculus TaxID=10090 RepID=Q3V0M3_MOUSE|nr:unnamed protein product [Mus musculus]